VRIRVEEGDITSIPVDAVVNAANEQLLHGGGVAAAIARAGGPAVDEESRAWVAANGPVRPGGAAVTSAGRLPARWIVHVVGPRYRPGRDNAALLRDAVAAALDAAAGAGARTVSVPAVSAGIFGYPPREAARVIAGAVRAWGDAHPDLLEEVVLVAFGPEVADGFRSPL